MLDINNIIDLWGKSEQADTIKKIYKLVNVDFNRMMTD